MIKMYIFNNNLYDNKIFKIFKLHLNFNNSKISKTQQTGMH